ncbi:MAG: hypothetical protein LBB65_07230, partial [Burkholderiales bacterium]|nr:hypothetical protein [Burkholderiales bacterium]
MKKQFFRGLTTTFAAFVFMTLQTTTFAAININYDGGSGSSVNPTIYIGQAIGPNPIRVVAAADPASAASLQIDTLNLPTGLTIQNGAPGLGTRDIWGTAEPGTAGAYASHFTDTTDSLTGTLTITVEAGPQTIAVDYGGSTNVSDIYVSVGTAAFMLNPYSTDGDGDVIDVAAMNPGFFVSQALIDAHQPAYTFAVSSGAS